MLHKIRPFDKRKDMEEVDQFGWLNLCEAYHNGTVSGDLAVTKEEFSPCEHVEAMIGRPADEFDAIRMGKFIKDRTPKKVVAPAAASSGDGA